MEKALKHLEKLVSFYPVSSNQESVKELLLYCSSELKKTGSFKDSSIKNSKGINSLYASTRSTKRPKLLLQAHIDVVPAGKASQKSLVVKSGKIIGRGVYDMLYAAACYLALADELKGDLDNLDLGILLTGDEELGGFNGVKAFLDDGYGAQVCVLPDAGEGFGNINVSHRGVYNFDLKAIGKSHHASRPWEGDGAANKLVAMLSYILSKTDNLAGSGFTAVVTMLSGGDSMNKGPSEAAAHLDIRFKDEASLRRAKEAISGAVKRYGGLTENFMNAPAFQLDTKNKLVKEFMDTYKAVAGHKISMSHAHGASDARFFAAKKIPVIMFRPVGGEAHGDGEWIDYEQVRKFYGLMTAYCQKVATIK